MGVFFPDGVILVDPEYLKDRKGEPDLRTVIGFCRNPGILSEAGGILSFSQTGRFYRAGQTQQNPE